MERNEEFETGGFQFATKEEAELAKGEQRKMAFLERRMQYDDPVSVLKVYNKSIENRVFETAVGFFYLQGIRTFLIEHGLGEEALCIPVYEKEEPGEQAGAHPAKGWVEAAKYRKQRKQFRKSVILNIVLVIAVVGMFIITLTGKNPNILNYERKIQDKYALWDQELTERESTVREKERALERERALE